MSKDYEYNVQTSETMIDLATIRLMLNRSRAPDASQIPSYSAYNRLPYDAPTLDMAAMLYAIRPESGSFQVSEPGTLQIAESGTPALVTGPTFSGSSHRALLINSARRQELLM